MVRDESKSCLRGLSMPSPFPGMDPYLEAPDIWPDFHSGFAGEIRAQLNSSLPSPFYARLEMRPEVGIVEEAGYTRRIVPDVAVVRRPQMGTGVESVAVLEAPRTTISKSVEVTIRSEPIRHAYVEIRDPSRGHALVTLIEIVSPSNKRRGPDRRTYLQKQSEVLESDVSLIELDLLRGGDRLLANVELQTWVGSLQPPPDYVVLINRAWQRAEGFRAFQIFPIPLDEPLPVIPVPLRQDQTELPLDLQYVFNRVYDSGPYRRGAVNYLQPPDPPLVDVQAAWAQHRLREASQTPAAGPP
jgi:Protein of unknown function (DUF4058)